MEPLALGLSLGKLKRKGTFTSSVLCIRCFYSQTDSQVRPVISVVSAAYMYVCGVKHPRGGKSTGKNQ